jgi:pyruvate kinase
MIFKSDIRFTSIQFRSIINSIFAEFGGMSMGESICSSAVKTAIDIDAKLILVLSDSGKMANYVARFRPGVPALMVSSNLVACRQASGLMTGMHTILVDSLDDSQSVIEEITYELVNSNTMRVGDKMVIVAGRMTGMKEQLRVVELGEGKSHGRLVEGGGLFFNRGMILSFSSR